MGTYPLNTQNQKNRLELTRAKRKPTAATDIMSVTYTGTKNAAICHFFALFGVVFGVQYGETRLVMYVYTPSNFFIEYLPLSQTMTLHV